jgi:hypothetical protein
MAVLPKRCRLRREGLRGKRLGKEWPGRDGLYPLHQGAVSARLLYSSLDEVV